MTQTMHPFVSCKAWKIISGLDSGIKRINNKKVEINHRIKGAM